MIDFSPIFRIMEERCVSQSELEIRLDLPRGMFSRLKSNIKNPKLETLYKIGAFFQVPISELIHFVDDEGNQPVMDSDFFIKKDLLSTVSVKSPVVKRAPEPKEIKEPDYNAPAVAFMAKFKEHYPNKPEKYNDYLEFLGRAYKQGAKDLFRKLVEEKRVNR